MSNRRTVPVLMTVQSNGRQHKGFHRLHRLHRHLSNFFQKKEIGK